MNNFSYNYSFNVEVFQQQQRNKHPFHCKFQNSCVSPRQDYFHRQIRELSWQDPAEKTVHIPEDINKIDGNKKKYIFCTNVQNSVTYCDETGCLRKGGTATPNARFVFAKVVAEFLEDLLYDVLWKIL